MNEIADTKAPIDQWAASSSLLEESQRASFPTRIEAFGLSVLVEAEVFSPNHFRGWEIFTRNFPSVVNENVLEIGCGSGVTSLYLAKRGARAVLAVDINPMAVRNTEENACLNVVRNLETRVSDIYSALRPDERFDTVYWNLPFIYAPPDYQYRNVLERGLFDPGYCNTEAFLAGARKHLVSGGRLLAGLGDFADLPRFMALAKKHRFSVRLIAAEPSSEINPVEFQLYELRPWPRVFHAMPFTGKSHADIVAFREELHRQCPQHGIDLLEQFVGVEEEKAYEIHGYSPLFIFRKDYRLLEQADFVIADYSRHSLGRDCEIVVAKEKMNKRVIAVVPDPRLRAHPAIRLYSDYVVDSETEAFRLVASLSVFDIPGNRSCFSRRQKDTVDAQIMKRCQEYGVASLEALFPTEMARRWQEQFGTNYSSVLEASFHPVPKTVRVNRLKSEPMHFAAIGAMHGWDPVTHPLDTHVYRIASQRRGTSFGATPEFRAGLFYVQDLASMLPVIALDPQRGESILDLGAAPGSKTTQMAEIMQNCGRIVAVDSSAERLDSVRATAARLGISIIEPRLADATGCFPEWYGRFDRVLVDGPCSCEGIIRYKPHKLFEWSLLDIHRLAETLEGMLESGFLALKAGGTLVYSTCTFAPEENEAIIDALLRKHPDAHLVQVTLPGIVSRPGLTQWTHFEYHPSLKYAMRILPQDNDCIGFFLAKIIRKP